MKKLLRSLFVLLILLSGSVNAATYYNKTGSTNAASTASWTTNAGGGAGTAPGGFTTAGDIFIIRVGTSIAQSADWTIGASVTLDIYGTFQVGGGRSYGCGFLGLSTCYDYYSLLMNANSTLYVRNGGTLQFFNDYLGGCTLQLPAVARANFEVNSTMLFSDGANKFDPQYNYGNLTFSDGTNTPSMGATYGLRVQGNFTLNNISAASFELSTTASLTHSIGGNLVMNNINKNFITSDGAGSPTLNVGGNVLLTNGSFYGSNGTGSSTVTISGGVTVGNAYFVATNWAGSSTITVSGTTTVSTGRVIICNSTGTATVTMGAVACNSAIPVPQTTPETHQFEIKTTAAAAGTSPSVTINGNLTLYGSSFSCNRTTGGTPVLTVNGNLIFQDIQFLNAGVPVSWGFTGTTSSGSANITITGNIDMSAMTSTQSAYFHVSNERDASAATTIGAVTLTVGSIVLGANGHFDAAFSSLGGGGTIYVNGSITGSGNSIMGGAHGANRTDANAPTIIFKAAGAPTTGTLWMTTGDFDLPGGGYNGSMKSPNGIGQFNVIIQNNRTITLSSNIDLGTNRTFTVQAGGTVITGPIGTPYVIGNRAGTPTTANTSFLLNPSSGALFSEIDANSPYGLTTAAASATAGNVQTSNRFYEPTANYRFDNTTSQATGDFLTTALNSHTVNKLIVNNTSAVPTIGLTLTSWVTVSSELTLMNGRLITTNVNLPTINNTATATGYSMTAANTNYVYGPIAKKSNSVASFIYPVGNPLLAAIGSFRPIKFTPTAATATTYQVALKGPNAGAVLSTLSWIEPLYYWDAQYNAGTTPVVANLYYSNTDISLANLAPWPLKNNYVTSAQYNVTGASKWDNMGFGAIDSVSSLHNIQTAINPTVTSGKFLAIAQSIKPLPVELVSFNGYSQKKQNILEWITASELNNDYFLLERSTDGKEFNSVGKIQGNGTTLLKKNYLAVDNSPETGLNYYRLKQVDYNGSFKYSSIITLSNLDQASSYRILKQGDITFLSYNSPNEESYQLKIFDLSGRMVSVQSGISLNGENRVLINNSGSPSGEYLIEFISKSDHKVLKFNF